MKKPLVIYYSTKSGNTKRFVSKLDVRTLAIPDSRDASLLIDEPYVLITPTYGSGNGSKAVPAPVIRFLNQPTVRAHLKGVIATGNRNFGDAFCLAGREIARRCDIPHLQSVEVFGTPEEVHHANHHIHAIIGTSS